MCHSFGSQAAGCVENVNSDHNSNSLCLAKSKSKFTMMLNFCFEKVKESTDMSSLAYVEFVWTGV